jgi:hypothetical protein
MIGVEMTYKKVRAAFNYEYSALAATALFSHSLALYFYRGVNGNSISLFADR